MITHRRSTQPAGQGVKVLLVEPDPMAREVLAVSLEGMGYAVLTVSGGLGAQRAARVFQPDIALIDLRPADGIDGATVARRLRSQGHLPVLFLAAVDDIDDAESAIDEGRADYLVRPFLVTELVARMSAVLRRSQPGGEAVTRIGDLEIDLDAKEVRRAGTIVEVTAREFALLARLGRRPGVVVSKTQLMADVWGDMGHSDVNLVEVHVSALRRKLEAFGPRLIHTVRGAGYIVRPETAPHRS